MLFLCYALQCVRQLENKLFSESMYEEYDESSKATGRMGGIYDNSCKSFKTGRELYRYIK